MSTTIEYEHVYEAAASYLLKATSYRPVVGIICGSGLSGLSESLQNRVTINYEDIPGFPNATVAGHKGELVFGTIGGIECVCMRGRFHYYEGNSMDQVVLPVRAMRVIGVRLLVVTNAAGGLNVNYNVGDIMIVQDHYGLPALAGNHPLRGVNNDRLGPRFPSMSDAYDEKLQTIVLAAAAELGLSDRVRANGTYCFLSGPTYETKAECRFLRSVGGDAVGMSTIPEVIAAKHCGMKILGLSLITNKVIAENSPDSVPASHAEVLQAVEASGKHVEAIVKVIMTNAIIGSYLSTVPPLPVYEIKPKLSITTNSNEEKTKPSSSSSAGDVFIALLGLAAVAGGLFIVLKSRK
mmetsp:Transcript_21197/g.29161  ORF Transcript_21197/g.29161 Transcript_21197/m.29161 type:complete len:351 (+) Transcript_21197:971-2023(+)